MNASFKRRWFTSATPLALVAAAVAAGVMAGCGLVFAPVAVPAAVSQNDWYAISGTVVDHTGQALQDVYVDQTWDRVWWDAALGTKTESKSSTLAVAADGSFSFKQRAQRVVWTFKKEGYKSREVGMDGDGLFSQGAQGESGRWPKGATVRIVLVPKDVKFPSLPLQTATISYPAERKLIKGISIPKIAAATGGLETVDVDPETAAAAEPGILYATLVRGGPPAARDGKIDPLDIALPEQVVLRFTGDVGAGGFVPYTPQFGSGPMAQMGEAPESGYRPELAIDRARLRAMRAAGDHRVLDGHVYFYFRADGRYGKGEVHWGTGGEGLDARLGFTVMVQPDSTRSLVSTEPQ